MEPNKQKTFVLLNLKQRKMMSDDYLVLTEQDFYPPYDDRTWKSNVEDIEGGDNFEDYCDEFFDLLDEEEYYDDNN